MLATGSIIMEPALTKGNNTSIADSKSDTEEKSVENDKNSGDPKKPHMARSTILERRKKKLEQETWLRESRILKTKYETIERQLASLFREKHVLWNQIRDIIDWKELMCQERNEKSTLLTDDIILTTKLVDQFQQYLENIQTNTQCMNLYWNCVKLI